MVQQADNTLAAIRKKVRRLTACSSESTLTTNDLDEYINCFYSNDFPYGIKMDQMRSVYTFYTRPYIDRYPLDVNYNQGVRSPMYVDGIPGSFFKDREQFFRMWPRYPTKFNQGTTTSSGVITNVDLAGTSTPTPTVRIVSTAHGLTSGDVVTIDNVVGTTELNGNSYQITLTPNQVNSFNLVGTDVVNFSAYISGGTWTTTLRTFIFTLSGTPFLSEEVTIGGIDPFGNAISLCDDGNGNILYTSPNPVVSVPGLTDLNPVNTGPPIPGMKNLNTLNPGLLTLSYIGTVNYVTGEFNFTLPAGVALASGEEFTIRISQYQTGRPYSLLFWNNEFHIRPIPKHIHKVEIETYLSPVQFLNSTDSPILNQWWQYIAIGAAIKILEDRQDMEGVENLSVLFDRQEALVLERQGVEEINQKNVTIYSGVSEGLGWNNGAQGWFGW